MRWAMPLIAVFITLSLGFAGSPGAPRLSRAAAADAMDGPGCGAPLPLAATVLQAVAAAPTEPATLWAGLRLGTRDSLSVAAWRGFIRHTKYGPATLDCPPGPL